jgi:HlyD family secretion protein
MMVEFEADLASTTSSMRQLMRWFAASSMMVFLGACGWATATTIDSAVVAEGTFAVPSSAQAVQHLEGGLVGAILVKDGDLVRQGQVIARLDAAKAISDLNILRHKIIDLAAEQARLQAEHDDKTNLTRPILPVSLDHPDTELDASLASQYNQLVERRSWRQSQLSQLREKKLQIETQITGLNARRKALDEELNQTLADLADQTRLDTLRLIRRPVLRQTEREVSRLRGEIGDKDAGIASARSQLAETEQRISEVMGQVGSEILSRIQTVSSQLAEAAYQYATAQDRIDRLEIRAPRTGYVHELAVHTLGGTIAPGQKLMNIIPSEESLLVIAKVRPQDIDQVFVNQPATVRISSFKMAVTPELNGTVLSVSPDRVADDKVGSGYYAAKIRIAAGERSKLEGKELVPGLPAEVLIRGEPRRVIAYLTQPLTDKLGVALREK